MEKSAKKCRSCNSVAGEKFNDAELAKVLNDSDELNPSQLERVLSWIFFISAAIFFVLGMIYFDTRELSILPAVFSILAGVSAGYPRALWALERARLSLRAHGTAELHPTELWTIRRKISYWIEIIGAFILFLTFMQF